ncbi:MAG TPA: riboflavin synthase [Steroidobacteraceae bacterium]|jgi:riboflavin synthase
MFTGIVQDIGQVAAIEPRAGDLRLTITTERLDLGRSAIGDSIAVAGVCLTAIELQPHAFSADVSRETLAHTTIGDWQPGRRVNLEPALRAGDALGGHLVVGHVDGVAQIHGRIEVARSQCFRIQAPDELARYLARKGSVAIDGVSLTVNAVSGSQIEVNLVPHTLEVTTLAELSAGDRVNLEVDLIARYTERLLAAGRP